MSLAPLASFVYLMLASIALAARRDDYSHVQRTLSELGESGARDARWAAWGVFLPVGLALGVVALQLSERDGVAALLALSLSVGYLGAAFFPCDPGAPLSGSWRQQLHTLAGAVEYGGGALMLLGLADAQGSVLYLSCALAVSAGGLALMLPALARVRGLVQRVVELVLFVVLSLTVR
jgi:hypothetical protein